jgi:hypothetical protein
MPAEVYPVAPGEHPPTLRVEGVVLQLVIHAQRRGQRLQDRPFAGRRFDAQLNDHGRRMPAGLGTENCALKAHSQQAISRGWDNALRWAWGCARPGIDSMPDAFAADMSDHSILIWSDYI